MRDVSAEIRVALDEQTPDLVRRFLRGEVTWAEVEGMSSTQAFAIGRVGCELAGSGRLNEARQIFEGLVAGNPKDAHAHAALGTVYQRQGRIDDARAAYDTALACDAQQVVALANRGELRLRAGDAGGAADLAAAMQADPEGETPAGRRAQALAQVLTRMREQGSLGSRPAA